jgi:hypothetical protein
MMPVIFDHGAYCPEYNTDGLMRFNDAMIPLMVLLICFGFYTK